MHEPGFGEIRPPAQAEHLPRREVELMKRVLDITYPAFQRQADRLKELGKHTPDADLRAELMSIRRHMIDGLIQLDHLLKEGLGISEDAWMELLDEYLEERTNASNSDLKSPSRGGAS